ncbi:MAG: hypothetical protein WCV86_00420 [Patescibacteria group bacterium]|jgi:hypothetical protein
MTEENAAVTEDRATVTKILWDAVEAMFMWLYDGVRTVMSGRLLFVVFALLMIDAMVNLYTVNHGLQNLSLGLVGVHFVLAILALAICIPFAKGMDFANGILRDKVPEDARNVADKVIRLVVAFVTGMLFFHVISHLFNAENNSVAFWFAILAFCGGFGIGYLRGWTSEVPYKIMAWLMIVAGIVFTIKLVNPYMHEVGAMGASEDLRASAEASGQFWVLNNALLKMPGLGLIYLIVRTVWWVSFIAGALSFKKMGALTLQFARRAALISLGICTAIIVLLFLIASGVVASGTDAALHTGTTITAPTAPNPANPFNAFVGAASVGILAIGIAIAQKNPKDPLRLLAAVVVVVVLGSGLWHFVLQHAA